MVQRQNQRQNFNFAKNVLKPKKKSEKELQKNVICILRWLIHTVKCSFIP